MNEELSDYIREQVAQGIGREEITASLLSAGWQEEDIEAAFAAQQPKSFPGPLVLLQGAVALVKNRLFTLFCFSVVLTALVFTDSRVIDSAKSLLVNAYLPTWVNSPVMLAFFVGFSAFEFWIAAALCYAVLHHAERAGIVESLRNTRRLLLPFFFTVFSAGIVISGGALLFVIPGIVAAIWFSFAVFVAVGENARGMQALLRSKEYAKGKFKSIFLRLFFLCGIGLLIIFFFGILAALVPLFRAPWYTSLVAAGVCAGFGPVAAAYLFLLYAAAKQSYAFSHAEAAHSEKRLSTPLFIRILTVLGALLAVPGMALVLLHIGAHDLPAPNDNDLMLSKVEISADDNAFTLLKEFIPTAEEMEEQNFREVIIPDGIEEGEVYRNVIEKDVWDEDAIAALLTNNKEALEVFQEASQRPIFQLPESADPAALFSNPFAAPVRSLIRLRILARLQTLSALWELRQGNQERAMEKLFSVVRLGHLTQKAQGSLLEYIMAMAMKNIGLDGLVKALLDLQFSSQDFSRLAQEILRYNDKETKTGLEKTWKGDYMFSKYVFTELARRDIVTNFLISGASEFHISDTEKVVLFLAVVSFSTHDFFYQPMRTLHFFEGQTRNRIENTYKFCREMRPYGPLRELLNEDVSSPSFWLRQNPFGRLWIRIVAQEFDGLFYRKCTMETKIAAVATAFALRAYQLENGILPMRLADLAPDFLSEAPRDAFDGGPLRYNPEKRIVYSPGTDFVDDGGDKEKDIVVGF